MKLPLSYYQSSDVVFLAKNMLGKQLFTNIDGKITGGLITETEAYAGIQDKASHAYGGRRTARTEIMFRNGGLSYVYLCYGIHCLFNVVTAEKDNPHAVLIRAIHPTYGIQEILRRRNRKKLSGDISDGPGKLTKALGINLGHNGLFLNSDNLWIEDSPINIPDASILVSKRIGVDYAGEDASLPYRFRLDNEFLAKKNAPELWGVK